MAKSGKVNQGTPRQGKRLGVKIYGGQIVDEGNIIIRQRGSQFYPGTGTRMGKDFTIFSIKQGKVNFRTLKGKEIVEVL